MPVLRVLIWHWGRKGGGPRYTLELARVLATRADLEVHLSISRQSEMYEDFADLDLAGRFDIDTYQSLSGFLLRSLALPWLARRFADYVREHAIDVVFCTMDHLWDAFMIPGIHSHGALYLLTVHDATRHPGEDQLWRRWLLARDIAGSDAALVLTRSVGAALVKQHHYPEDRVFLSTLGHFGSGNEASVRSLVQQRPVRLLFFGRILAYKGLDLMLEALPLIQREFPDTALEVWGSGDVAPYRSQLEASRNVRVENRWIEEQEIPGILAGSDLAVLPYREASQSAVVATAFAAGMPCVVSPIPGLCEQVEDGVTGTIAAGLTPGDFAEAVLRVLRDPALYVRLSKGCLEATATALSWSSIGESVVAALKGVHAHGRRDQKGATQA